MRCCGLPQADLVAPNAAEHRPCGCHRRAVVAVGVASYVYLAMPVTIDSFDASMYQRLPPMTLEHALALGGALLERVPQEAPSHVLRTRERLRAVVLEGREALTIRLRERPPAYTKDEVALDTAADALWATLRSRLEAWRAFEHAALGATKGAASRRNRTATMLAGAAKKAERARCLLERIYGPRGLAFLQTSYFEQCEAMSALLRLIEEDDLTADLTELAGEEWMVALTLVQGRYEAMVQKRMGRSRGNSGDLNRLRLRLHRSILRYNTAILTMLDEDDPESLEIVTEALRPLAIVRDRKRKRVRSSEEENVEGEDALENDLASRTPGRLRSVSV